MDQKTQQAFRDLIKQPTEVRELTHFQINLLLQKNKIQEDVEILLRLCYEEIVSRRKIKYQASFELTTYIAMATKWLIHDRKPGLLLYGNFGSGKSTMGKAISLLIPKISSGNFVVSTTASSLCDLAASDTEKFNALKEMKMLYVDEVGREQLTVQNYGTKINPFLRLLEYRYDHQMFTILTTNLTEEGIEEKYGTYISERITENFEKINYTNKSYRTNK